MNPIKPEPGYRWVVAMKYDGPLKMVSRIPVEGRLTINGERAEVGPIRSFIVTDDQLAEAKGEFATAEEAVALCEALNDADASSELSNDPVFVARRERLKALGETFWVRYGEGYPAARWPSEPARYAIKSYSERYSETFWETYETLADVQAEILTGDVVRVVDLDTGEDVPFTLSAQVGESA